jgi:uncharacterized protein YecT (DUF1311 family)
MIGCTVRAGKEWDKELNTNYNLLMSKLNVDEKEKLKTAQRNWIAYRDKENGVCPDNVCQSRGNDVANRYGG